MTKFWQVYNSLIHLALGALGALIMCLVHTSYPLLAPLSFVPIYFNLAYGTSTQIFYATLLRSLLESLLFIKVIDVGLPVFIALTSVHILYRLAFCLQVIGYQPKNLWLQLFYLPSVWIFYEWLYEYIPSTMPYPLGDTQYKGIFLPLARLGGTYLLSFMLIWLGILLSYTLLKRTALLKNFRLTLAWGIWLVVFGGLYYTAKIDYQRNIRQINKDKAGLTINMVQGGLNSALYQQAKNDLSFARYPLNVYLRLSRQAKPADLTLWPESTIDQVWPEDKKLVQSLKNLRKEINSDLLIGLPIRIETGELMNGGLLLGKNATFTAKRRLVLGYESYFHAGKKINLQPYKGTTLGIVFCLESTVPHYSKELAKNGAEVLIILVNDSLLDDSYLAPIHAHKTILRAVETGKSIAHVSASGLSMFAYPDGQTSKITSMYSQEILRAKLTPTNYKTPFVRYGNYIVYLAIGYFSLLYALNLWQYLLRDKQSKPTIP